MFTIPTQKIVYQPQSAENNKILRNSNIMTNWEYRKYIQKNANEIMKYNTMSAINASGNNPYVVDQIKAESSPFLYMSTHDNRSPSVGHKNTDMREQYLKNEQFKSRKIAPVIPTSWF
jgi:hypothetical protein